jgi:hypothetical protein
VPWALYGVAAVGAVGFTVLGLSAKSDADHLRATCAPRCATDDVNHAETKAHLADASLAIGLISAGIATYWLLSASDAPVVVGATSHGAFARWETAF